MRRPIAIGLAPNLEKSDAQKALSLLLRPWMYTKGSESRALEQWFETQYKGMLAVSFTSARGALFAILQSLSLKKGDEVLVQAFTCKAVIEPLLVLGLTPVYVDIQKDFTLSEKDVVKKITNRTKVFILQHTFGIPNISQKLLQKVKENDILIVEDMAHIVETKHKELGKIGDATIVSFGRDKAFSCVSGGIAMTQSKMLGEKIRQFQRKQKYPSQFWIFQNLFHSVSFYFLILPFYDTYKLGKALLVLFQKLHLLSVPVEKHGVKNFQLYYQKLPPSLASLALLQLGRLDEFNKKREEMVAFYNRFFSSNNSFLGPLLRYPFYTNTPDEMKAYFQKHNIYVGDWYAHIIDPKSTDLREVGYEIGMCPTAENIAHHMINLPTYPTLGNTDKEKIAMILTQYAKSKRNTE